MVFFTCNGCGESLKKAQVEKHRYKCRNSHSLTCIDCVKDFHGDDYAQHLKCVSEDQKYGGANYVAKENKGEVKQEKWIEQVQKAIDAASNSHNQRLARLLENIRNFPNIPRKEAKFKNFLYNSLRERDQKLIAEAWNAIAAKKSAEPKEDETNQRKDEKTESAVENGEADVENGEAAVENGKADVEKEAVQSKSNKKKRKIDADQSEMSKIDESKNEMAENGEPVIENEAGQSKSSKKKRKNHTDQSETIKKADVEAADVENESSQSKSSKKKRKHNADQSESVAADSKKPKTSDSPADPAPDSSANQIDQSATNEGGAEPSSDSPNDTPAPESQMDQSAPSEGGVESIDDQSKETTGGQKSSIKSIIKKLLKEADEQKLSLKRLKKLTAKNLAVSETREKAKIYEEIDLFLRKNAKKYVVDGKVVKFAQEN